MYCKECGSKNKKGSVVCKECGAKLEITEEDKNKKEDKEPKDKNEKTKKTNLEENKQDKKEKKKSKKKKSKNKKHKKAKIIILVVIFLCLIGVGAFFGWKYYDSTRSVGSTWGDTYYYFIRDSKDKKNKNQIPDGASIKFIEVPKIEDPVMVVTHEKYKGDYSDIYYINDGKVDNAISSEPSDIEFLYNIESKEYNWYVHTEDNKTEYYVPIAEVIASDGKENVDNSYTYQTDEKITVETIDGEELSMNKFASEFIAPDIEIDDFEYSDNLSNASLQEVMTETVEEYQTIKDITTDKIKQEVKNQVEKINQQIEEMKAAEEEAKSAFKVGSFTLKYGTYESECYGQEEVGNCGRYTIKPDGSYTYTMPNSKHYDSDTEEAVYTNVQESGTYEAKTTYNGIGPNPTPVLSICFTPTKTNVDSKYLYYSKGESEECFEVSSNNSWNGVQYPNLHTYIG